MAEGSLRRKKEKKKKKKTKAEEFHLANLARLGSLASKNWKKFDKTLQGSKKFSGWSSRRNLQWVKQGMSCKRSIKANL